MRDPFATGDDRTAVLAREEARSLKHDFVGTEHILLGLLREEKGIAARVLTSLDITVERVQANVVRSAGVGHAAAAGQPQFTAGAKRVLELALREALSLRHNYIGTEHILLGVGRQNDGVAGALGEALEHAAGLPGRLGRADR